MKDTVLLAVRSPLYAPVYLAQILGLGGWEHIRLEYPKQPTATEDPLIDALVGRDKTRTDQPIAAIADPLRIVQAHCENSRLLVIGRMIQRMCYWMFDEDAPYPNERQFSDYTKWFVHPVGMTGFAVAWHAADCDSAGEKFFQVHPECAKTAYFCRMPSRRLGKRQFAYMGTEPLEKYTERHLKNFPIAASRDNDILVNTFMTAIIATAPVRQDCQGEEVCDYQDSAYLQAVELKQGVYQAIGILQKEKLDDLANILRKAYHPDNEFYKKYSFIETRRIVEYLRGGVYVDDLSFEEEHVKNIIKLWSKLKPKYGDDNNIVAQISKYEDTKLFDEFFEKHFVNESVDDGEALKRDELNRKAEVRYDRVHRIVAAGAGRLYDHANIQIVPFDRLQILLALLMILYCVFVPLHVLYYKSSFSMEFILMWVAFSVGPFVAFLHVVSNQRLHRYHTFFAVSCASAVVFVLFSLLRIMQKLLNSGSLDVVVSEALVMSMTIGALWGVMLWIWKYYDISFWLIRWADELNLFGERMKLPFRTLGDMFPRPIKRLLSKKNFAL